MRVLLTGAFGNLGQSTLDELLLLGHQVRCFDLRTRSNERAARRRAGQAEVIWGDLRRREDLVAAVQGQEAAIHLAFILPSLSSTGAGTEARPEWARQINVGGTRNLLDALRTLPSRPRIVFASSQAVYGLTQHLPPPRTAAEPVAPFDHYSQHKVECEQMVCESGLPWAVLRLPAALPLAIRLDPGMFDVPLDNRIEFGHTRDVGAALARAVSSEGVWGRTLLIGGGTRCQFTYRELVGPLLEAMGVGMLPEEAFARAPFCTDWLDSRESQALLQYQTRGLDDYSREMTAMLGYRRFLIRCFRPLVRAWVLRKSPYWRERPSRLRRPRRKVASEGQRLG